MEEAGKVWRKADAFVERQRGCRGVPARWCSPPLLTRRELRASWQLRAVQLQVMRSSGEGLHSAGGQGEKKRQAK